MKIVIIDGQGGSIGAQLVRQLQKALPQAELIAIGTNSAATGAMLKSAASPVSAATGENAVIVAARSADLIAGPIGIVLADALLGEVTPNMAAAVGSSRAMKVLIPMSRCDTLIAGFSDSPIAALIEDAVQKIVRLAGSKD